MSSLRTDPRDISFEHGFTLFLVIRLLPFHAPGVICQVGCPAPGPLATIEKGLGNAVSILVTDASGNNSPTIYAELEHYKFAAIAFELRPFSDHGWRLAIHTDR